MPCPAIRPHFFGACPKKRCRAAKEKRFLPRRLHHPRERYKSVDGTFLARLGEGGGGWPGAQVSLTQSAGMLGLRVRGRCGWDRTCPVAAPISAFLWGSTPFLCARAKKWGGTGRTSAVYCQRKRRTRVKRKTRRPCLCLLRVRRYVGRWSMACPAIRPHFFGACPKKRCRAAKEKRFFTPEAPPSA